MTHNRVCGTYFGFHDPQQSLWVIHAPQRGRRDWGFDVNVSAFMTQNRPDIAVAFRDAHTNENVCDHKDIKTLERLQEVAG
ncbi:MAG: hypothetical protein KAU52_02465 [Methanosarcinales archaeon]|nr:hypothetical protein [Methanosarcinales archaeon]